MYPVQGSLWWEARHCAFGAACTVIDPLEKLRKDDRAKMCFVVDYKYEGVAAGLRAR
jgi:hypothetical protein